MRSLPPQLSFADLELQFQGVQLDPSLRAVSAFLDQHLTLIEQVRKDLERSLKNARTGRNGIAPSQVLRSLVLMRWPKKDIPAHSAGMKSVDKVVTLTVEFVVAEALMG